MGRLIAGNIKGMGLAVKVGLVMAITLALSTAMWYHPLWVQAVSKQYVLQPSAAAFATGVTGNTTCATDITSVNNIYELVTPGPSSCASTDISYQIPQTNGTVWLEGIFNTAYTQSTTVTGTSLQIDAGDDGNAGTFTIGIQLYSLASSGTKTTIGGQVNFTTSTNAMTKYTIPLTGVTGTVASGSKLGFKIIYVGPAVGTPSVPRLSVGSTTALGGQGGILIVDEAAGDTTPPTVSTFAASTPSTSRNIPITAFTASDNVGVAGYLITTSSTQPTSGAAGWTATAPTTYTVAADGSYTLYPWAKDAAGNVSAVYGSPVSVTVDTVAPTVSSTIPTNAATGVALNGSVTINWSEAVNCTTVNTTNVIASGGTLALASCSGSQAVFTTGGQANSTSYTVTVGTGVKDVAGNSMAASYPFSFTTVVAADTTPPTVTAFTMPATATSLTVAVSSFTATDNVAVTGYLITESATAPAAGAAGWTSTAPTSFTFSGYGAKTAYAWAKDAAGNVSASRSASVTISDATAPTVTAFTMPATATSLTVTVNSFTATDNVGVTGYLITESATAPSAGAAGWTATAPTSFTFSAAGAKTAYAWAKDAAGNVSTSLSANVTITLPDTTAPSLTAFTMPSTATSLSVLITAFTATDNVGVTGWMVKENNTTPLAGDTGWLAAQPSAFTFAAAGLRTAYAWVKDAAGNISNMLSAAVTITLPDTTAPTVTAFTMPATASSLTVAVNSFTATDNVGVTGYLITESATAPTAGAAGWGATAPTSYTFSASGVKTAYAWAKDAAGNVSTSLSANVTITLPSDTTAPTVTAFTMPATANALLVPVNSFTATDNVGVTGYLITESATAPSAGAAGWSATAPTSYTFSAAGAKTAYAWAKDAAGNVSASANASVTITITQGPLVHSSNNLGYKYGTWGTSYNCATCHNEASNNIKGIAGSIITPTGSRSVVFDRLTSSVDRAGVFGDDLRALGNGSTNVCEVCHHNTLHHQYSSAKIADRVTNPHYNRRDCISCHLHSAAFKGAGCDGCHGNPPNSGTVGAGGLATPATNALGAAPANGGAHVTHTGAPRSMACNTCHSGYGVKAMPSNTIDIGFAINNGNFPGFGPTAVTTGALNAPNALNAPYTWSPAAGTTITSNAGAMTCSLYCHGSTLTGGTVTVPNWAVIDGTQKACGACHGASSATPPTTGSHIRHAGNTATSLAVPCASCHGAHPDNSHVDGVVKWDLTALAATSQYKTPTGAYATTGNTGGLAPSASYGQCNNVYCHSTVQGATGTGAPATYATPTWGGAALTCGSCHADMSGASGTGSHVKHANGYGISCGICHGTGFTPTTVVYPTHANNTINLAMNGIANGTAYSKTSSIVPGSAVYGTCATSYCHSNGQSPATYTTPTWGFGALPADCSGCHGTATSNTLSGKHSKHLNPAANTIMGLGNGFGCKECHAKTVSSNTTIGNQALHVNQFIDYSGVKAGGSARYSTATKSCTNIYCHSNGNPNAIVYQNPSAWNSATTYGCNGCHGITGFGAPDYANGGAGTATANSHPAHVTKLGITTTTGCATCHVKTADLATANKFKDYTAASYHLNGGPNVIFNTLGGKTGTWNGSTCSVTYCHGTAASPAWGSASLACNSCHGANNALPGAHGIHYASATVAASYLTYSGNVSTSGAYRFSCASCHSAAKGAVHANGPANANGAAQIFYAFTSATMKGGTYAYGTLQGNDNGFNWSNGSTSCNTTYCHGNGQGGSGLAAVAWSTTASSGTCIQCHDTKQTGATATGLSGKHDKHMNPTNNTIMGLGNGFNCIDCHAKTVSGNTTLADKSKHVNKFIDYSGVRAGGSAKYSTATKQCTNIYCHSNGNPSATVYQNPAAWNSATTYGCNGCHGTTSAIGAPDYANGGAGTTTANSHAKHVAGATDTTVCSTCHVKTANMTVAGKFKDYTAVSYHLNRTPNVMFNTAKAGATATWTQSSNVCNNVTCHGGTGSTATWGATLNCQDCHGNGATASVADFGATFWNNGTISKFQMTGTGSWAGNGHGLATGTYPGSGNPAANFGVVTNQCEFCHDSTVGHNLASNPFRLRNYSTATYGRNAPCLTCHSATGAGVTISTTTKKRTTSKAIEADHYGTKHTSALNGGQFCWDCHDPHGTGLNSSSTANQYMVRNNPAQVSNSATSAPTTQTATGVVFTLSATPTGTDYAKSATPFNGVCNVCHTTTSHYTTTTGDSHNSTTRCTNCHSHVGSTHGSDAFKPTGHSFPYYGSLHKTAAGSTPFTGCVTTGCHTNTKASSYPVTAGTPPDCQGCHTKTSPGTGCITCHGTAADGRPAGTAWPDTQRGHNADANHSAQVCSYCHGIYGSPRDDHGPGNRTTHNQTYIDTHVKTQITQWSGGNPGTCNGYNCTQGNFTHSTESW